MSKRSRHLTGLTAYFHRKRRSPFKYCTSSEDEETIPPSSDSNKADCTDKPDTTSVSRSSGDLKSDATSRPVETKQTKPKKRKLNL